MMRIKSRMRTKMIKILIMIKRMRINNRMRTTIIGIIIRLMIPIIQKIMKIMKMIMMTTKRKIK